jgi:DNA polymerase I-like protein with 3'-5' exonuclease and polymerase domains
MANTKPSVAIVEKQPSNVEYDQIFEFSATVYQLVDHKLPAGAKMKKADITLDFSVLANYDYIILVGAEPAKTIAKVSSVTAYQGNLIEGKYIPIVNPALVVMRPEMQNAYYNAVGKINKIISGEVVQPAKVVALAIDNEDEAYAYLSEAVKYDVIAMDTETDALYPRDGRLLGISISFNRFEGAYISADAIDDRCETILQTIASTKKVVFHNAKFDINFLRFYLKLKFVDIEDTMLMHYLLDENNPHGLKELTMKYTPSLGDYEQELVKWKQDYCKVNKVKVGDFNYGLIPWEVISKYAAYDTIATLELYHKFLPYMKEDPNLSKVYWNILLPATLVLSQVEDNGVPFNKDALLEASEELSKRILKYESDIYSFPEVLEREKATSQKFNVNSPQQVRDILFSPAYFGLQPSGKLTGTGALSTDAEVLQELGNQARGFPSLLLTIKQAKKIKATYIDKVLTSLDSDNRLRTFYNLATTTSGRLSSSGKLNMQQLPRDDKTVKKCIKARPGYKIISQDLVTAEVYVAAVLSGDANLQSVFSTGDDLHSSIAKIAFNLECPASDVKKLYPQMRQASKAITFGILYGAGPQKVAETINCSVDEAKDIIEQYFTKFPTLKKWLKNQQDIIKNKGAIYSALGRKRHLRDVFSPDRAVASKEIRSGVNFLIQSVASDINLLATIDLQNWITNNHKETKIFGLVHDSILAEVPDAEVEEYCAMAKFFTQKDRGVSIKNFPIGVDVEIGDSYAFGS